jgi:CubicO group peptidase (beta-lactamase class C family)
LQRWEYILQSIDGHTLFLDLRVCHFSARGNYGQFIYIAPEERLVIVRHGYDFGNINWINLFESIAAATPQ